MYVACFSITQIDPPHCYPAMSQLAWSSSPPSIEHYTYFHCHGADTTAGVSPKAERRNRGRNRRHKVSARRSEERPEVTPALIFILPPPPPTLVYPPPISPLHLLLLLLLSATSRQFAWHSHLPLANFPRHPPHETVRAHIAHLHAYNEIRDVGQGLIGLVADGRNVRAAEVYEEFGVSDKD